MPLSAPVVGQPDKIPRGGGGGGGGGQYSKSLCVTESGLKNAGGDRDKAPLIPRIAVDFTEVVLIY